MPIEQGFEDRIVTSRTLGEDTEVEYSLRPKALTEYIGQNKVKENLTVYIEAAKARKEPLDMCCFTALRGLAKPPLRALLPTKWA